LQSLEKWVWQGKGVAIRAGIHSKDAGTGDTGTQPIEKDWFAGFLLRNPLVASNPAEDFQAHLFQPPLLAHAFMPTQLIHRAIRQGSGILVILEPFAPQERLQVEPTLGC
jgi:hypothetical protein